MRLTLWNCLLFGTIIAVVITVIYFFHKQDTYENVDLILTNVASHVEEEITKQLNKGQPLEKVSISANSLSVNDIAIMIKNKTGEVILTNSHPYFKEHQLTQKHVATGNSVYQTISIGPGSRLRTKIIPLYQDILKRFIH